MLPDGAEQKPPAEASPLARRGGAPRTKQIPEQNGGTMSEQKPSIGRIVHYVLGEGDVKNIAERFADQLGRTMNRPQVGDVYPAVIVRVFTGDCVNLKVELDGEPTYWATSRRCDTGAASGAATEQSYEAGTWHWPPRV